MNKRLRSRDKTLETKSKSINSREENFPSNTAEGWREKATVSFFFCFEIASQTLCRTRRNKIEKIYLPKGARVYPRLWEFNERIYLPELRPPVTISLREKKIEGLWLSWGKEWRRFFWKKPVIRKHTKFSIEIRVGRNSRNQIISLDDPLVKWERLILAQIGSLDL